jgi:hypothetical protein
MEKGDFQRRLERRRIRCVFGHLRIVILPLLIVLTTTSEMLAQGRGKIAGVVRDAETKEPLIGANVFVQGTNLGSATDVEGQYAILNVPPGRYTVLASMVGYGRVEVNEVQVNIDLTTSLDIELKPAAIELGTVVVVAKPPVVVKDRTETFTSVSAREVTTAPVEGLRQILELSSSVQRNPNGTISIRGSGSYEVNFMIDGVSQMTSSTGIPGFAAALGDKANNTWKYDFNPLGVQQLQLISGGFSAEYGNAQAGVVKVVTKEGGDRLRGEVRVEYRPPGQYHWGDYIYNTNSIEWQRWGTLEQWRRNIDSLTIVQTYQVPPDSVDIWRRLMHQVWVQNHTPGPANQLGAYDYRAFSYRRIIFGIGGPLGNDASRLRFHLSGEHRENPTRIPTVEKVQVYDNYTLTLVYQPAIGHKLKFGGLYQYYRGGLYSGSEDIRWAGRDASYKYYLITDSPRDEHTLSQSVTWTWTFSPQAFLETQLTHQYERNVLLVEPVPQRASTWRDNVYRNIWYQFPGPWDEGYRTIFSFTTFNQQDFRSHFYGLTSNFTAQLTRNNMLKAGVQLNYWDMFNSAVYSSFAANAFISRTGFAEYYTALPYYFAAYVQDKMEYEGMVANLGVRVDGYNFNTDMPYDRFNPLYIAEGAEAVGDPRTTRPKTHVRVSPRLGLSFPIGEATAFRLQYGHFVSMPLFSQAYTRTNELGWASYGNADLGPKKTINYEFGLQHSLGGTHRLDLVAYYNDRVSQIGTVQIRAQSGAIRRNKFYTSYDNNQFGSTRGIDVTLEKVAPGRWNYRATYSFSRTTLGFYGPRRLFSPDPNDPRNYQDPYAPNDFLSGDDRTHGLRALISYSTEKDEGMEVFGLKPFSEMTISATYTAQTGTPYTYVPSYDVLYNAYVKDQVNNNRRFPLESKVDANITKWLRIGSTSVLLGIRIVNLFDNKWLTPLGYKTPEMVDWVEKNITVDNPAYDPTRQAYKFNYFRAYRNAPRQVFFTVGVAFE